jgi:hypothetical protein
VSYQDTELSGLAERAHADGRIAFTADAVYVSDDGWTWREVFRD